MSKILFRVKVNPQTSRVLQNVAFKCDYQWNLHGKEVSYLERKYLSFWDNKSITHTNTDVNDKAYPEIDTVEKAINYLCTGIIDGVETLKIKGHDITIKQDGSIKFGCTDLSKEEVDHIILIRKDLIN